MKRIRNYAVLPENVFKMIKTLNDKGVDRDTICELCHVSKRTVDNCIKAKSYYLRNMVCAKNDCDGYSPLDTEEYIEAYNKGYVSGYSNATEKAIKIIQEMSDQVFEVSKNE